MDTPEHEIDLFEFAELSQAANPSPAPETAPEQGAKFNRNTMEQSVLAFVLSLHPDAVARNVPTRNAKYRATAGAFWKHARTRGSIVTRTILVMMYDDIGNCFSDCEGREERLKKISALQQQKELMEADIRKNEPHLAAADDLFSEFRTWDYSASENNEYHRLCRKLARELETLCKGSKLERIRQAGVADQCYLAVPEELLIPELIPAPWGIVGLRSSSLRFKLIREAEVQENVTPAMRSSFAFNIGTAAANAVCFASGVDKDGTLRRPPRKRGKLAGK
ncbi:MAG: hypothetical protein E7054_08335 [Lentisphaerae bacterium]|nr:hypothetical protein [Lentisphaerota bacterium]